MVIGEIMKKCFATRRKAGEALATKLSKYAQRGDVFVLALPRGGIPVAYEVARALHAPLDVFLVRKLGVPGYEELAMGAIATGGVRVLNKEVAEAVDISEARMRWRVFYRERAEITKRLILEKGL
jgi:putative phosphoribosyl transferase